VGERNNENEGLVGCAAAREVKDKLYAIRGSKGKPQDAKVHRTGTKSSMR
jgi:hypothetical protein